MALSGGLSKTSIRDLLQCLTERRPDQERRSRPRRAGWPDGRREFGSVGKAVLAVLAAADKDLTAQEIRHRAETLLGGAISRHSIAYQLQTRSKGSDPTIIQTDGRYYGLRADRPPPRAPSSAINHDR